MRCCHTPSEVSLTTRRRALEWTTPTRTDQPSRLLALGRIDAISPKPNLDRTVLLSCLKAFERSTDGFPERFRLDYLSTFDELLIIEKKQR